MQQAWTFLISSAWNNYSITGNSDISNEMLSNIHDWNKLQIKYNCCYKVCTNCDKLCQQQPSFWVVYVIMCMCEMTAIQSTAMWNFLLEMNRNKTQYRHTIIPKLDDFITRSCWSINPTWTSSLDSLVTCLKMEKNLSQMTRKPKVVCLCREKAHRSNKKDEAILCTVSVIIIINLHFL